MDASSLNLKLRRVYLPQDFEPLDLQQMKEQYQLLLNKSVNSLKELEDWLVYRSEWQTAISEAIRWLSIRTTCDTESKKFKEEQSDFLVNIKPELTKMMNELDRKFIDSSFTEQLPTVPYGNMIRVAKMQQRLFSEENLELLSKEQLLGKEYFAVCGKMEVVVDGEALTMQQARMMLQDSDRDRRELVYNLIQNCMRDYRDEMETIFDELLIVRNQIATNAGFDNYRDYKFADLGRFDYDPSACFEFHEAIEKEIRPLVERIDKEKLESLGVDKLRPWDNAIDGANEDPLVPFIGQEDLISKAVDTLTATDPFFGECLQLMSEVGRLDLESRKAKAPGGYNMSLPESGIPFVFMNATGIVRNVKTIVHEAGHSVHSFLNNNLGLYEFKNIPSEIAELAAMTMELFSLENWQGTFFNSDDEFARARKKQLYSVLRVLPWVATIDAFQHWLYTNPGHSREEREVSWNTINHRFRSSVIKYDGLEWTEGMSWLMQLHLFHVPFYYIEYGMAQLGAIAAWINYRNDPKLAIEKYKNALSLGYTKPIGEIYEEAGIKFDFSQKYIHELGSFLSAELWEADAVLHN